MSKMNLMLHGQFESDPGEQLYDLIKGYFHEIEGMSKEDLIDFVREFKADPQAEKYQAGYEVPA
jgi:hypothetical protein